MGFGFCSSLGSGSELWDLGFRSSLGFAFAAPRLAALSFGIWDLGSARNPMGFVRSQEVEGWALGFGICDFGVDAFAAGWAFGIWDLGFGVWDLGSGIWDLGSGIWDLGFGIWDLGFGIWDLGSGIWDLGSGIWELSWELLEESDPKLGFRARWEMSD